MLDILEMEDEIFKLESSLADGETVEQVPYFMFSWLNN